MVKQKILYFFMVVKKTDGTSPLHFCRYLWCLEYQIFCQCFKPHCTFYLLHEIDDKKTIVLKVQEEHLKIEKMT